MTMILDGTAGATFPTWTTGTRPATPSVGQVGWNTTIGSLENYNGSAWTAVGGGGAGQWQAVQTTGFTAVSGNAYACNTTSAAFTVTLPASPSAGNYIVLTDYARTWNTNNLTINPNGLKIQGSTSNVVLTINGQSVSLVYIDSTQGWLAYTNSVTQLTNYTVSYLIVAGGAGGGGTSVNGGGGGGAGGLLTSSTSVSSGATYSIIVGGGGATPAGAGGQGSSSSAFGATAVGGGGGGSQGSTGIAGGSGGGAGRDANSSSSGGSGTSGQGFAGGAALTASNNSGGGGGGAGGTGYNGAAPDNVTRAGTASQGGIGLQSSLSGTPTYYAGGGGGSWEAGTNRAPGGSGGGGAGGGSVAGAGVAGSANTGGGGGGGQNPYAAGAGGSGIVIISYAGAQRGTGGTYTSVGGNSIHTFTSSGTYTA